MTGEVIKTITGQEVVAGIQDACPSGMISYWKMDESSGTTASDSVDTLPGTLIGNSAFVPGHIGNAVQLLGYPPQTAVTIPNSQTLGNSLDEITVEAVVKPVVLQYGKIIEKMDDGSGEVVFTMALGWLTPTGYNGQFKNSAGTTYFLISGVNGNTAQWAHVVMTYKRNNYAKIYVNGILRQQSAVANLPLWNTNYNVDIGRNRHGIGVGWGDTGGFYKGLVDEVAIYNRSLTDGGCTVGVSCDGEIGIQYANLLLGKGYCELASCTDGATQPCGTDVGECVAGTQTCSGGAWGACIGGVNSTTEICDGLDNDCDGTTDENLGSTTCGVGACQRTVQNCVGGIPQTCVPGSPVSENTDELCNDNIDNDCDGDTDFPDDVTYCTIGGGTQALPDCTLDELFDFNRDGVWDSQDTSLLLRWIVAREQNANLWGPETTWPGCTLKYPVARNPAVTVEESGYP